MVKNSRTSEPNCQVSEPGPTRRLSSSSSVGKSRPGIAASSSGLVRIVGNTYHPYQASGPGKNGAGGPYAGRLYGPSRYSRNIRAAQKRGAIERNDALIRAIQAAGSPSGARS